MKSRWWLALLIVPLVAGLLRLRLDVDVLNLLPADLPAVKGLKLHQEHFADAREMLITIRSEDAEFSQTAAAAIGQRLRDSDAWVEAAFWQPPWQEDPNLMAELLAYIWLNQPPDEFSKLEERLTPAGANEALANARESLATSLTPGDIAQASYDPLGLTRLPESSSGPSLLEPGENPYASADGLFRLVTVRSRHPLPGYRECEQWIQIIQAIVAESLAANPAGKQVEVGYTGGPVFTAEIARDMQGDLEFSVVSTGLVIAALFWLAHRRLLPMLWLLLLLTAVLVSTLAAGGLLFGTINVLAVGFAAILLGLGVDYALVHYQETLEHPELSISEVRKLIAPGVFWAATTTVVAFLGLNFGGLPGLAQLGTLVAVGVILSAVFMLFAFLPPLFRARRVAESPAVIASVASRAPVWRFVVSAMVLCGIGAVLAWKGLPGIDATADPLRPGKSQAYQAMEHIQQQITRESDPVWLVISGENAGTVEEKIAFAEDRLSQAHRAGILSRYSLPGSIWPRPQAQAENSLAAMEIANRRDVLLKLAEEHGFEERAFSLFWRVSEIWRQAAAAGGAWMPTNSASEWVLSRAIANKGEKNLALGVASIVPGNESSLESLQNDLAAQGIWLSGWQLLGKGIYSRVRGNLVWLAAPVIILVLTSLLLAFRNWRETLLSLAVLALSSLALLALMSLAGWSWNLLNLVALPLIAGTGVDYTIFMQLGLRRYGGDLRRTHRSIGRALLLCGGTAMAGFGSLAFASNPGLASLGVVCAAGIALNVLTSTYLLPAWWLKFVKGTSPGPSSFYSAQAWRLGMAMARYAPRKLAAVLARLVMFFYWMSAAHRRRVVAENLTPVLGGNRREASRVSRRLFLNFGIKMLDLWRYEAGEEIAPLLEESTGWDHFLEAKARGRGVLLVTIHLGNWEFGGPCHTREGERLLVLTLSEPGEDFTMLRKANRAKWNVETIVIQSDPFAFLEPVRRLQDGTSVALLIDRPVPQTAVPVRLFGREIFFSSAAAELARASGCALLPVCIPHQGTGYGAHILPEIPYERERLRQREARQELTQKLADAFAPFIARYPDQWYHFVRVWPEA